MAESDSVGPVWLGPAMVETRRVREEGNWVCLEGVSKGWGESERFRIELVPKFFS